MCHAMLARSEQLDQEGVCVFQKEKVVCFGGNCIVVYRKWKCGWIILFKVKVKLVGGSINKYRDTNLGQIKMGLVGHVMKVRLCLRALGVH